MTRTTVWPSRCTCIAKKKYEVEIRGLLMLVEAYVRENSIYRNKALIGVGQVTGGQYKEPEFFNPYTVNRETGRLRH